ncbi:unnamed protein product, partial [Symbiodinium pilosum]
ADCDSLPPLAAAKAQLALRHGGQGLRSAVRHASAAYWVFWTNCLQLLARREPAFAERLSAFLAGSDSLLLALDSLRLASHSLSVASFQLPASHDLSRMDSLQQHDDFDVSVQWRSAAGNATPSRRSRPAGHATRGRALEPTGIREEFAQSRLRSGSTDMGFAGQLEDRRGKRSLRSHGNVTPRRWEAHSAACHPGIPTYTHGAAAALRGCDCFRR